MIDLNTTCPDCGRDDTYVGNFTANHHGRSKLLFKCVTACTECGFGDEYTTSLE